MHKILYIHCVEKTFDVNYETRILLRKINVPAKLKYKVEFNLIVNLAD